MSHAFHPSSLREYDIRGIVGKTLGPDDAYAVGRCFGTLVRRGGGSSVAVGRDGRESSPAFEEALVRGLKESGADAVRIGLGPTPMLYFAEAELDVDGGIMITGSHNPADYNGFKMVLFGDAFFGAQHPGARPDGGRGRLGERRGRGPRRGSARPLCRPPARRASTAAPSGSAGTPATARPGRRWRSWSASCRASIICSTPRSTAASPTTIPTRPTRPISPI